jgi:hypothetical protein
LQVGPRPDGVGQESRIARLQVALRVEFQHSLPACHREFPVRYGVVADAALYRCKCGSTVPQPHSTGVDLV